MNDRELEALLRATSELAQFERDSGEGDYELGRSPRSLAIRPHRWHAVFAGVAATAAGLLWWVSVQPQPDPRPPVDLFASAVKPVTVELCHVPSTARPSAQRADRIDVLQPTVSDNCQLVALMRTWSQECGCLLWSLHEWQDGSTSASARRGEPLNIELAAGDAPSYDQMVVLAIARDGGKLPSGAADAQALLECLNEHSSSAGDDLDRSAAVVAACLPQGVTVVPHRYSVDPR